MLRPLSKHKWRGLQLPIFAIDTTHVGVFLWYLEIALSHKPKRKK